MGVNIKKHMALLGCKVNDKVTGFTGVVSSMSFDLYGCIQAIVTPQTKDDGTSIDSRWFDVSRLMVLDTSPVMQVPDYDFGPIAEGKQGCSDKPRQSY